MSAILAVLHRNREPVDREVLDRMLVASAHRAVDGQHSWVGGHVALAHQHFWITPEEHGETQPLLDTVNSAVITADVRLDNRPELIEALELKHSQGHQLSDASLILEAYQRWGADCVNQLLGDFAWAIWDAKEQHLLVARDALGVRGLYYFLDHRIFVVASEISQVLAHPAVQRRINEGRIADYLVSSWENVEETFYEGVLCCPPAHYMVVSAVAVCRRRYWDIDPQRRIRYRRDEDYAEHFLTLLSEAVRCRLRGTGTVGISLSGGLDSTALAALAANLLPQTPGTGRRIKSFSYVFDELRSCDERPYIEPVAERYDIDATFIPGDDKWPLRDLPRWPVHPDFVYHDAYVWLPISVMKAAQQAGCRVLLTGHYGDHLYEGAQFWLADILRELRLRDVPWCLPGKLSGVKWRRDLIDHGLLQLVPRRLRHAYRRLRPRPAGLRNPGLHPRLAAKVHQREQNYGDGDWRRFRGPGQWERYCGLTHGSMSQGLPIATGLYNEHCVELEVPYVDRRLIEYVLAIPADQLGRPHRTRWLLRNAMTGLLPELVRQRPGKTTFYPLFEKGLRQKEHSTVMAMLHDPQIVHREFIRTEWLRDELNSSHPWTSEGYYLWLCISLELWLKRYW